MKTADFPSRLPLLSLGCLLGLALVSLASAEPSTPAPLRSSGPAKVRILVTENSGPAPGSASPAATPAHAATPAPIPQAGKPTPAKAAALAAATAADAKTYSRTTNKSFTISVVNLTAANMDVVVKTNALGKDEAGKHEVLTEKTLENKLTLLPNRPESFSTEEVPFTHMTAHRGPAPKAGAGAGGTAKRGGPIASMEAASGHAYFGYRVEVFQGNDLVGVEASEIH